MEKLFFFVQRLSSIRNFEKMGEKSEFINPLFVSPICFLFEFFQVATIPKDCKMYRYWPVN